MLLGVHCSINGGFENALIEAERLGIDTFQVFTKNQRQWREKQITEAEGKKFKKQLKQSGIKVAFSHTQYLINLASEDEIIRKNSILALEGELLRCHVLGFPFTVLHPGASRGLSEIQAIVKIAEALNLVLRNSGNIKVKVLLENTAGQGSSIGWKFRHIAEIMKRVDSPGIGMCFDTCHAFSAGYDIRTNEGFEATMEEVDKLIGLNRLLAFHLNDSKGRLGSRIDRHEHIGKGELGLVPFRLIMNFFKKIPKVLETKKDNDMDIKNLEVLRSLALG